MFLFRTFSPDFPLHVTKIKCGGSHNITVYFSLIVWPFNTHFYTSFPQLMIWIYMSQFHYKETHLRVCSYRYNGEALWVNSVWVVYVCVCAYVSICDRPLMFSLDEYEYRTPTPFPHTLTEHQNIFLCTWIAAEHYKWTSKMPAITMVSLYSTSPY